MTHKVVIAIILLVQLLCAFFFVSEIMASVLGIAYQPLDWAFVELIEIGAAVGLILGSCPGRRRAARELPPHPPGRGERCAAPRPPSWRCSRSVSPTGA